MAEKINKKDLFGKLDLKGEIKSLEAMLKVIDELQKQIKVLSKNKLSEVIAIDVTTLKGIKELNEAKAEANKLSKQSEELEKKQVVAKKKLVELTEEELEAKIKQQQIDSERRKTIKEKIILEDKESGTLERIAAANSKLRKERAKLNLETDKGKKRLVEINGTLDKNNELIKESSDVMKKQRLNVGNYEGAIAKLDGAFGGMLGSIKDSVEGMRDQGKALVASGKAADTTGKKMKVLGSILKGGAIGLVVVALGVLAKSFGDSRADVKLLQGTMDKFTLSVGIIGKRILDAVKNIGSGFALMSLEVQIAMAKLPEALGGSEESIAALEAKVKSTKEGMVEWSSITSGIGEQLKAGTKAIDDFATKTEELEDQIALTSEAIIKMKLQEELLSEASGDGTISLQKQLEAQVEYQKVLKERIKAESELALLETDAAAFTIQQKLLKVKRVYTIEQIKSLDFLDKENGKYKDLAAQQAINGEVLGTLTSAQQRLFELESEGEANKQKNLKETRQTRQDLFEKELDFAIDIFDKQKTINERIINSEKTTVAERLRLTEELSALTDSSFESQKELFARFASDKLDINSLIALDDEKQVRKAVEGFGLTEIHLTRLMEIINERKIAQQDIIDLEDETIKKQKENIQAIKDSEQSTEQDDFSLKIEEMEKELDAKRDLENLKVQAEKDAIEEIKDVKIAQLEDQAAFEIEAAENSIIEADVLAAKKLEIEKKLANDIKRLDEEAEAEKKELNDKKLEKDIAEAQETFGKIADIWREGLDERERILDQEFEDSKSQEANLQNLAREGVLFADESLAIEKQKQKEIEKERAKSSKKRQTIAATEAALDLMGSYAKGGSKTPFKDALGDLSKMFTAISAIQFFNEGTESVGGIDTGVDSVHAMLRPTERVFTVDQNKMIGNISNDEAASVLQAYQNGAFNERIVPMIAEKKTHESNKELLAKMDDVNRSIKNIPVASIDPHAIAGFVTETIATQNRIDRNHHKANQIFK
jgi:hypothetical protein